MDMPDAIADFLRWYVRFPGTLLLFAFSAVLWSRARSRYYGLWTAAWLVEAAAVACAAEYIGTGGEGWRAGYGAADFVFTLLLAAIAWAGLYRHERTIAAAPTVLRLLSIGLGLDYLYHAALFIGVLAWSRPADWFAALESAGIYDLGLHFVLLFLAVLAWLQTQNAAMVELAIELEQVRQEFTSSREIDGLTGLLNQTALAKELERDTAFTGVVSVCDLDNFKEVNDRYGHLVGDEILRNVGHLFRSSIRQEDDAFRWGGDEFIILFHNQDRNVVRERMEVIQARLRGFRLRGHGVIPISFSWGIAESDRRPLREVLDEADHDMYSYKRSRKTT